MASRSTVYPRRRAKSELLALLFLLLAGCASTTKSDLWKDHDFSGFTLTLPNYLRDKKARGFDSFIGTFEGRGLQVNFDYGWYSDTLERLGPNVVRENREIGARRAVVAAWNGHGKWLYATAIHFPALAPQTPALTIFVLSMNPQSVSERIFSSVRFHEEPIPPAPTHDQPPAKAVEFILSHDDGWRFTLFPDGRAVAQFGSLFGDNATLPVGSIDFEFIVQKARALLLPDHNRTGAQLVIVEDDTLELYMHYLAEDRFLREALERNWNKWVFGTGGKARLRPLLEKIKRPKQPLPSPPKSEAPPAAKSSTP